jgi:hypothetical protein
VNYVGLGMWGIGGVLWLAQEDGGEGERGPGGCLA